MRHGSGHRKFQKSTAHTIAMFRNMATSLMMLEQVETTVEKAKELRPIVEKLITLAKNDTVAGRRRASSFLKSKESVARLFTVVGPRFKARNGGYTRIVRTRSRAGDAADMAILAMIEKTERKAAPAKSEKASA